MPDIAMCMNKDCKARMDCFRYRAEPNPYRQSYMSFNNNEPIDKCKVFLDVSSNDGYKLVNVEELQ